MTKFLKKLGALALAAVVLAVPALPASASFGRLHTLQSSVTKTSTFTGSTVGLAIGQSSSSPPWISACADSLTVVLSATAASGTMALTVEGSNDGTLWATLPASSAFTAITSTGTQAVVYPSPPRYVRAKATISGGSPTFTYSVTGWGLYTGGL